jgi:hypothetical protein
MKITEKQIKDYHAQAEGYLKREIEKDYPDVFKVDLWDKWLVDDKYPLWMLYFKKETNSYKGLDGLSNWVEKKMDEDPNKNKRNKPATQEQILEMLSKEAVKRGYKDGNHKCLNNKNTILCVDTGFNYCDRTNSLLFNWNVIFKDGTWAAIIEPVYEWKYLIKFIESKEFKATNYFYTSKKEIQAIDYKVISKIKETKRLRK